MKALVTATGNTALIKDIPIPEPGPKEILIKVHSVALNPVDAYYVAHPVDQTPGRVVGSDVAGTIEKIGINVSGWGVGDRVAGLLQGAASADPRPGGFAEYAILEEDLAIRIPKGVSFEEAATFPLCSLTAAQALSIRLEINAPFASPFQFIETFQNSPSILVYSGATSVGLFAIGLARNLRTGGGHPYRIFATASPKHHNKLLALGVEAVYDYRSPTWPKELLNASGGISYAVDCLSEDDSTALISQTFVEDGGKIAVVRKSSWRKEGVRQNVIPLYGAAWSGLANEILYNGEVLPSWRPFTVAFFQYLSAGSPEDSTKFPIPPNPIRIMPGGLERIVEDGFTLLGSAKVSERHLNSGSGADGRSEWMRPISGEKLVYNIL